MATQEPARAVQWSDHLGTMCSRAWRTQWPRSRVQSEPWPSNTLVTNATIVGYGCRMMWKWSNLHLV